MRFARSFRLRLALIATAVCAAVLLGFSWAAWTHVYSAATARVDREISRVSRHHIHFVGSHDHHPPRNYPAVFLGTDLPVLEFWARAHDGKTLDRSRGWPSGIEASELPHPSAIHVEGIHPSHEPSHGGANRVEFATVEDGGTSWRLARHDDADKSIVIAVDLRHFESNLDPLRLHWWLTLGSALVLAFLGAWWHASRALRPVHALTEALEEITAEDLDRRIPSSGGYDEFQRLETVCNGMLERLETSFSQAVRFSADASHEMQTPLAIMQGQVEDTMHSMPEGSPAQVALATQLEEIGRLKNLVRKLLLLSQADSGSLPVNLADVDFSAALRSLVEDIEVLAPELELRVDIATDVVVEADDGLLQQILQNLASNAVKYNHPPGSHTAGWIRISLSRAGATAILRVENSGEPIAKKDAARIFDRFFRRDSARSRKIDGLGLGLSLSREIARALGGDLWFDGSGEDSNRFCVRLAIGHAAS